MHSVNCNLCGAQGNRLITIQNNYRMVKCDYCGLVYLNPRPSLATLIKLYNDYHQRDGKDEHSWAKLMEKNFRQASDLLNRLFPDKGNVLDIGCGYGHFIRIMKDSGWSVTGIEPSSRTSGYALSKGLTVYETTIDDAILSKDFFEAVTAFYVFEHLLDPLAALEKVFTLLKPGGVLVLRLPHTTPLVNLLSLFNIKNNLYDLPFHLYDFSPRTISLLLEKAGFSLIRVTPGCPTLPARLPERLISQASGVLSSFLFSISRGALLMPGTSKTIIAIKPADNKARGN
jgi:SAM-dependent methyltransferase